MTSGRILGHDISRVRCKGKDVWNAVKPFYIYNGGPGGSWTLTRNAGAQSYNYEGSGGSGPGTAGGSVWVGAVSKSTEYAFTQYASEQFNRNNCKTFEFKLDYLSLVNNVNTFIQIGNKSFNLAGKTIGKTYTIDISDQSNTINCYIYLMSGGNTSSQLRVSGLRCY